MAKDKSEKKDKKRKETKEVTETVETTLEVNDDVEMEDTELVKVSSFVSLLQTSFITGNRLRRRSGKKRRRS